MSIKRTLLLNADFSPLNFVSDIRAISLSLNERAVVIDGLDGRPSEWDFVMNSPSIRINVPATMRLVKKIDRKWRAPRFRRTTMFLRDNWTCQFCGKKITQSLLTVDHVVPRSKGGKTSWKNCVAACKPCNKRKANKTIEEAGMKLACVPKVPDIVNFCTLTRSQNHWHPDWDIWFRNK